MRHSARAGPILTTEHLYSPIELCLRNHIIITCYSQEWTVPALKDVRFQMPLRHIHWTVPCQWNISHRAGKHLCLDTYACFRLPFRATEKHASFIFLREFWPYHDLWGGLLCFTPRTPDLNWPGQLSKSCYCYVIRKFHGFVNNKQYISEHLENAGSIARHGLFMPAGDVGSRTGGISW